MSTINNDTVQKFSGKALKTARISLKLSQSDFAKKLGLTGGYISKLEKNERLPKETVVQSLIATYGLSRDYLEGKKTKDEIQLPILAAEEMVSYGGFPEPVRKTIAIMMNNPDRLWEIYAVVLEHIGELRTKNTGDKP